MSSLVEGFSYDVFISYRQKDNKYDGWVTEFADNLGKELESTFKEPVTVYFDQNPHDGLTEAHNVAASLTDKLKCLIFIPVISRTYCDTGSFAWNHELKAFVELARSDRYGLQIRLPDGNVSGRVLPVRIHDTNQADIRNFEQVIESPFRGIEFIYRSPGVNRPLRSKEDSPAENQNKTFYRNQINKTALAIKDIVEGINLRSGEACKSGSGSIRTYEKRQTLINSIIVLPFENISNDPEQEYFADGLTEELITDLSHVPDIMVISRSSAMTFKGLKKTIPEIAAAVNVRYVLEGSIRKSGNNIRITAQLIDSGTDTHLWSEKYSGVLEDIFTIQENVSGKIVGALKGHLTANDSKKLFSTAQERNVGVYDAYARAHYYFWKYEPGCQERSLKILEEAVGVFGDHPILLSGIGAIHWQMYQQMGDLNEVHISKIRECAARIFKADADSPYGHRLKSYIDLHSGNADDAIGHLYKAMEYEPSDAETLLWLSYLLTVHAGRPDEALPIAERWRMIDPMQPMSQMSDFLIQWYNGNYQHASERIRYWCDKEPDNPLPLFYLGQLYIWVGRTDECRKCAESILVKNPDDGLSQILMFLSYCAAGERQNAEKALSPATRDWIWVDFHLPWLMAEGYSLLGMKDEALFWLERTIERGIFNYPVLNEFDPLLANIRNEPRFRKAMKNVKLKWEKFRQ